MPILQAYPLGASMHTPTLASPPPPGLRGEVKGWSAAAARRHVTFLQSVDAPALTGYGYAVTLTVRHPVEAAEAWARIRDTWLRDLRRNGMIRYHWVTEWQRRGAPHLHAAVYFPHELTAAERLGLLRAWLRVASRYEPLIFGQRVEVLRSAASWARYCAKHSARSSSHAQREGMPPGWTKSGRLWGQGGEWPTRVERWAIDQAAYVQLRRLVRSWRIANARAEKDPRTRARRLVRARRCLRRPERSAAIWGMREWVPEDVTRRMVEWLGQQGYEAVRILDGEVIDGGAVEECLRQQIG